LKIALGSGALATAFPPSIARALAIPASQRTGTIADVEHIVILTQENRSFDHYFGSLAGVRGFADPRAVTLRSGRPVWFQPSDAGDLLPFRPDVPDVGRMFIPDPPHGWNDSHAAWNGGEYDQWVPSKGVPTMTYCTRRDIPYHYALADAFTICDAYYCSVLGPTDPNRYHMWTGWVGNDGRNGGPVINNAELGYDWSTYPERLQRNGISWKVYQDVGLGLTADQFWGWTADAFIGNFGDNSLLYFHQYQNAPAGSPLAIGAKTGTDIVALGREPNRLFDVFRDDVRTGALPQVSWIAAPEAYSEHPNWPGDYGAWYMSQVLDILTSNPDVWSKTVLFITYDENGGFFDHLVPPTPPPSPGQGLSTVPLTNEIFPGDLTHPTGPYGLGVRVPMLVVSPWSIGGWVNSQTFDHTSLIRFIEARFAAGNPDLIETNITPWRRAVAGDLTTAFDFAHPNASRNIKLPDTGTDMPTDLTRHSDDAVVPPANPSLPSQEPGVRPARALPYTLEAHGRIDGGSYRIDFLNVGSAAAVFHVRSANASDASRSYTVGPGAQVSDVWDVAAHATDKYDVSAYGPNGFLRAFKGSIAGARLDVREAYDPRSNRITLTIANDAAQPAVVVISDRYTGKTTVATLASGDTMSPRWSLSNSSGWYDFVITVNGDPAFATQVAGHLETGADGISDPLMGGVM
jgi:phospholipase C